MLFNIEVSGERACFPRPGFHRDIVSHDVMPPAVAVRLLAALYADPAIRWTVERLVLLAPISVGWDTVESGERPTRAWVVQQPRYVLTARMAGADGADVATVERHGTAFYKTMLGAGPERRPFLGLPACPAALGMLLPHQPVEPHPSLIGSERDLGWLPCDAGGPEPDPIGHVHAVLRDGVLTLPPMLREQLAM